MREEYYIIISYEELVSLMLLCGYSAGITGMEIPEFKMSREEQLRYAKLHEQKLVDNKLIERIDEKTINIDLDMAHILSVLMFHDLSFLVQITFASRGVRKQYVYDVQTPAIIEHTELKNGQHCFRIFQSDEEFYSRIQKLINITEKRDNSEPVPYILSEKNAFRIINEVKRNERKFTQNTLAETGMPPELINSFINVLEKPEITFSIMCLAFYEQKLVKGSSVSIFANNDSVWGCWPFHDKKSEKSEEKEVALFECNQSDVISVFQSWIDRMFEIKKEEEHEDDE